MILANDFSSGLIRFQKLLAQMANRVLLDLARADYIKQGNNKKVDYGVKLQVNTEFFKL